MKPIRVLLADDHEILRDSMRVFFEVYDDFELVGEVSNGIEAIVACHDLHPDIILMDLLMPDMDGIAATRIIRKQFPEISIIALTSFSTPDLIESALKAGVSGYLLKNLAIGMLGEALHTVREGKRVFSPEISQILDSPSTQDG